MMQKTFEHMGQESSAVFSDCRTWRYSLSRKWAPGPRVLFILLNPSRANEHKNDPTIIRCMRFANGWGFGSLIVCNLFAFRTPSPELMKNADDPIGPDNDDWIIGRAIGADQIILAWGAHGNYLSRDSAVLEILKGRELFCLGKTKDGFPKHPLYLPRHTRPELFQ